MEVVEQGTSLVSNAEVMELIANIKSEAREGKYMRPKVLHASMCCL